MLWSEQQKQRGSNISASLSPLYTTGGEQNTFYIENHNSSINATLTFPGCYLLKVKMIVKKELKNPYAEVFLSMGGKLPCRRPEEETYTDQYCRNESEPSYKWCPMSKDQTVRSYPTAACRFCDLCHHADNVGKDVKESRKFFQTLGGQLEDSCAFTNLYEPYTLNFQICTPSEQDFEDFDAEVDGDLSTYWEYMQHGSMKLTFHLLERDRNPPHFATECDRWCQNYQTLVGDEQVYEAYLKTKSENQRSYKYGLEQYIRHYCVPKDHYVTCFTTTIKYSVNSNFKK